MNSPNASRDPRGLDPSQIPTSDEASEALSNPNSAEDSSSVELSELRRLITLEGAEKNPPPPGSPKGSPTRPGGAEGFGLSDLRHGAVGRKEQEEKQFRRPVGSHEFPEGILSLDEGDEESPRSTAAHRSAPSTSIQRLELEQFRLASLEVQRKILDLCRRIESTGYEARREAQLELVKTLVSLHQYNAMPVEDIACGLNLNLAHAIYCDAHKLNYWEGRVKFYEEFGGKVSSAKGSRNQITGWIDAEKRPKGERAASPPNRGGVGETGGREFAKGTLESSDFERLEDLIRGENLSDSWKAKIGQALFGVWGRAERSKYLELRALLAKKIETARATNARDIASERLLAVLYTLGRRGKEYGLFGDKIADEVALGEQMLHTLAVVEGDPIAEREYLKFLSWKLKQPNLTKSAREEAFIQFHTIGHKLIESMRWADLHRTPYDSRSLMIYAEFVVDALLESSALLQRLPDRKAIIAQIRQIKLVSQLLKRSEKMNGLEMVPPGLAAKLANLEATMKPESLAENDANVMPVSLRPEETLREEISTFPELATFLRAVFLQGEEADFLVPILGRFACSHHLPHISELLNPAPMPMISGTTRPEDFDSLAWESFGGGYRQLPPAYGQLLRSVMAQNLNLEMGSGNPLALGIHYIENGKQFDGPPEERYELRGNWVASTAAKFELEPSQKAELAKYFSTLGHKYRRNHILNYDGTRLHWQEAACRAERAFEMAAAIGDVEAGKQRIDMQLDEVVKLSPEEREVEDRQLYARMATLAHSGDRYGKVVASFLLDRKRDHEPLSDSQRSNRLLNWSREVLEPDQQNLNPKQAFPVECAMAQAILIGANPTSEAVEGLLNNIEQIRNSWSIENPNYVPGWMWSLWVRLGSQLDDANVDVGEGMVQIENCLDAIADGNSEAYKFLAASISESVDDPFVAAPDVQALRQRKLFVEYLQQCVLEQREIFAERSIDERLEIPQFHPGEAGRPMSIAEGLYVRGIDIENRHRVLWTASTARKMAMLPVLVNLSKAAVVGVVIGVSVLTALTGGAAILIATRAGGTLAKLKKELEARRAKAKQVLRSSRTRDP